MAIEHTKAKLKGAGRRPGPTPKAWLTALSTASGYSRHYLSRAIRGKVNGPVVKTVEEARAKGLIPQR